MEQVHGVDVSWMTRGSPRDKASSTPSYSSSPKTPAPAHPRSIPHPTPNPRNPAGTANPSAAVQPNGQPGPGSSGGASPTPRRLSRSALATSFERPNGPNGPNGLNGTLLPRRNSWFSTISAKFTGSSNSPPGHSPANQHSNHHIHDQEQQALSGQSQDSPLNQSQEQSATPADESPVPKFHLARNAVLPHAMRPEGNGPYTPAPPKSGQAGILGVFRRLSATGSNSLSSGKQGNGLVQRVTFNIDQNRERCPIAELKDAKLRRVAFCVDVEIAPMPKYADMDVVQKSADKSTGKRATDKGEGEALKTLKAVDAPEEANDDGRGHSEPVANEPETAENYADGSSANDASPPAEHDKDTTKKEKKKSEEERKARKKKRRRLAEENGSVPMEIYDSSDSASDTHSGTGTPCSRTTTSQPTTNPTRIYRRCCQLRETPILKRITEQLADNSCSATGVINKLDLTDYWLQLPDLVTLGDWLAVVPVKEIVLENSGLGDEGVRVILAGLLSATRPASSRRKRPSHEREAQGCVVERVVLKNNKLGPDGWKHVSLFVYKCKSLKYLDISQTAFPKQAPSNSGGAQVPRSIADVFSKAIADRLGGSTLELLNIGETEPNMGQLSTITDGVTKCAVGRLGLAHNRLDGQGVAAVARYLVGGHCEGLDLGGNDLRHHTEAIAGAINDNAPLCALSLAGCNLDQASLGKMVPSLIRLGNLRFIDLSHNHDLFRSTPSVVGLLRKFLPQMECLKRIHLQDVGMTSEQAIAIVEVLPEVRSLAHINVLGNVALMELAGAKTTEAQEEACALYASLLAASRVSQSLICVDIEVPADEVGEIVKAMAKQVVAYCLRNMERLPDTNTSAAAAAAAAMTETQSSAVRECKAAMYPDVLAHLVGHDVLDETELAGEDDSVPDGDYVIGGTGVVKALRCCLENRGEAGGQASLVAGGKAKDMSKHLLAGARKIRVRLQPSLAKARANPGDEQNLRKLTFLDETLQGIIKRFEDEFPDTREGEAAGGGDGGSSGGEATARAAGPAGSDSAVAVSDGEDESEIQVPKAARRSSSKLSKVQAEEGRVLRAGHRFRSGVARQEQLDLLSTMDDLGAHPKHGRMLEELAEDLGGEMLAKVREKGAIRAFKEDKETLFRSMRDSDPDHWERFVESQHKARANIRVSSPAGERAGDGD